MSAGTDTKVAPDLKKKLSSCRAEEVVRVIGVIRQSARADEAGSDSPAESRTAYREGLIKAQAGVRAANASVLAQVRALGLEPRGGEMTGVFSVDASKQDVERLLELDDIASLSLDKDIVLHRPSR